MSQGSSMMSPPTHAGQMSLNQSRRSVDQMSVSPTAGAANRSAVGLHPHAAPTSTPATSPLRMGLTLCSNAATIAAANSAITPISLYAIDPVTTDQGAASTIAPASAPHTLEAFAPTRRQSDVPAEAVIIAATTVIHACNSWLAMRGAPSASIIAVGALPAPSTTATCANAASMYPGKYE
ncbi:MAG: hypothetical protein ED559_12130 [Phycisphaera sp.]|nr:MAG: hypothetical protein ED559_12130 [Phycisphaera sp.]